LAVLSEGPATDRVQRFEENHPNLFGDAEMIQKALYFGTILSNDHSDVLRMASLAGMRCRPT
jgi:hypothetical protein